MAAATTLSITQSVNTNNNFATMKALSTKRAIGLKDAPINSYGGISANDNMLCQNEINAGKLWSRSECMVVGDLYVGGNIYTPKNLVSTNEGIILTQPLIPNPNFKFPIDFSPLYNYTTSEPVILPTQTASLFSVNPQNFKNKEINGIKYSFDKYVLSENPTLDFGSLQQRWTHMFSTNVDTINTLSIFGDFEELNTHKNIFLGTNVNTKPILEITQKYADTVKINGSLEIVDFNESNLFHIIHDLSQMIINCDININDFIQINKDDKSFKINSKIETNNLMVKNFIEIKPQIINIKHSSIIVDITNTIIFLYASTSSIVNLNINKHLNNVVIKLILKNVSDGTNIKIQLDKSSYVKMSEKNDYVELLFIDNKFEFVSGKKPFSSS